MPALATALAVQVRIVPVAFAGEIEPGSIVHATDGMGIVVGESHCTGVQPVIRLSGDEFRGDHQVAVQILRRAFALYMQEPRDEFSVAVPI